MVGMIVIGISMMAYYAFLERLAVQVGANPAETGRIVAGAQVAGIIGGLLAAPVARRLGLVAGLCAVSILHAVTITLAVWTDTVFVLGAVAFFEAVLFIIMIPLMLTLAAGIDTKGRWAAIAGGVFVISTAIGPVVGAFLIEETGYDAIAWMQWPAVLLAVSIFVLVSRGRTVKN
jgi:predicted MFS family arabinose efflux permease